MRRFFRTYSEYQGWLRARQVGLVCDLIVVLCVLIMVRLACAQGATVVWDPNSEADLAGYKLYWGLNQGAHTSVLVVNELDTFHVITGHTGLQYYVVTAYDSAFNESPPSNEIWIDHASDTWGDVGDTTGHSLVTGLLTIAIDDSYTLYFNNNLVGADGLWDTVERWTVFPVEGTNWIHIEAASIGGPAGMVMALESGGRVWVRSDSSWQVTPGFRSFGRAGASTISGWNGIAGLPDGLWIWSTSGTTATFIKEFEFSSVNLVLKVRSGENIQFRRIEK